MDPLYRAVATGHVHMYRLCASDQHYLAERHMLDIRTARDETAHGHAKNQRNTQLVWTTAQLWLANPISSITASP